jgi:hypothetical protein
MEVRGWLFFTSRQRASEALVWVLSTCVMRVKTNFPEIHDPKPGARPHTRTHAHAHAHASLKTLPCNLSLFRRKKIRKWSVNASTTKYLFTNRWPQCYRLFFFSYNSNKSQTTREVLSLNMYTARWCNSVRTVHIPGVQAYYQLTTSSPMPSLGSSNSIDRPLKMAPTNKNPDDLSQVILWAVQFFRLFDEEYKSWSSSFSITKHKKNDYNLPRSSGCVTIRVLFPNMDLAVAQAPSRPLTAEARI